MTGNFYNSGGNANGGLGLHGKRMDQILSPSKVIVANDYAFGMYGWISEAPGPRERPFQYAWWHHDTVPCWGNVAFVDGHIDYRLATYNQPDYQNGQGWTFVFDGPR